LRIGVGQLHIGTCRIVPPEMMTACNVYTCTGTGIRYTLHVHVQADKLVACTLKRVHNRRMANAMTAVPPHIHAPLHACTSTSVV